MFSNQRNWKSIFAMFFKGTEFIEFSARFSLKLIASVIDALFFFSLISWKMKGVVIENSDKPTCCDGTFFELNLSFVFLPERCYHPKLKCQFGSIVVTFDNVSVLVFVTNDLQFWFCFEVEVWNVHFQLEFARMKKIQMNLLGIPNMAWYLCSKYFRVGWIRDLQWISLCFFSCISIWYYKWLILSKSSISFRLVLIISFSIFGWNIWIPITSSMSS